MKIFIFSKDLEFAKNLVLWLDLKSENYVLLSDINNLPVTTSEETILMYDPPESIEFFLIPEFKIPTILFVNRNYYTSLQYFLTSPHIHHFIAKNEESIKFLLNPIQQKIQGPLFLGIEKYFPAGSVKSPVKSLALKKYSEKQLCFDLVKETLSQSHHFEALADYAMTVTSELLMNAFFDAPIDKTTKTHLFINHPREKDVELPGDCVNVFSCAISSKWLAISMTDPFGSLNQASAEKALRRSSRTAGEEQFRSLKTNEGAGVGLYLIYNYICHIIFRIKPYEKTEVICFFKITKQQKEYENYIKSFQFLERTL